MRGAFYRNQIFTTTEAKGEMLMQNRNRDIQLMIRVMEEERRLMQKDGDIDNEKPGKAWHNGCMLSSFGRLPAKGG